MNNFKALHIEIISPAGIVFDDYCHMATIPTTNGDLGIMKNYESTLSRLRAGKIDIYNDKSQIIKSFEITGGFANNVEDKLIVLLDN